MLKLCHIQFSYSLEIDMQVISSDCSKPLAWESISENIESIISDDKEELYLARLRRSNSSPNS